MFSFCWIYWDLGIPGQDFHIQDWNLQSRASKGNEVVYQHDICVCGEVFWNANSGYLVSQTGWSKWEVSSIQDPHTGLKKIICLVKNAKVLCPVGVACFHGVAHKVTSPLQGLLKRDANSPMLHWVLSMQKSEEKCKCEKAISQKGL